MRYIIKMKTTAVFVVYDKQENLDSALQLSRHEAITLAHTLNQLHKTA